LRRYQLGHVEFPGDCFVKEYNVVGQSPKNRPLR
jgi:hypothetical protein